MIRSKLFIAGFSTLFCASVVLSLVSSTAAQRPRSTGDRTDLINDVKAPPTDLINDAKAPPQEATHARRKWEYKIVDARDISATPVPENDRGAIMENMLNDLGEKGWEFAQHVNGRTIFKRPKQ